MKDVEVTVSRVAAGQLGLVTRHQLLAAGMSTTQIRQRQAAGYLLAEYAGVYRLASWFSSPEQRLLAACLKGGPGTVASHRAAAWLWGMRGFERPWLEITSPGRHRRIPGAITHDTGHVHPCDVSVHRSVPITSPARTLFDLGGVVPARAVEAALDDCLLQGRVSFSWLVRCHERLGGRGRRGSQVLGTLLEGRAPNTAPTQSALESAILEALRSGNLPDPVRQYPVAVGGESGSAPDAVHRVYLDFAYPHVKLAIEGDSVRWHAARADLQRNSVKRNLLVARGWRVLAFTWDDVTRRPDHLAATVRRELDAAGKTSATNFPAALPELPPKSVA